MSEKKCRCEKNRHSKKGGKLKEEVGVIESFARKLVRSRLKWVGHVKTMEGVWMTESANAHGVEVEGEEEDLYSDGRTA